MGPLDSLIPVFVDAETTYTKEVSLTRMTLRQYLAAADVQSLALAIGYDAPQFFRFEKGKPKEENAQLPSLLAELANSEQHVFVAHNAAFDMRVLRFKLDMPQPKHVWCSMEGAMAAWPELSGGYSLDNIAEKLKFPPGLRKMEVDLEKMDEVELQEYNLQDVRVMQEIYRHELKWIPALEQEVGLRTHQQRQFYFHVDPDKLSALLEYLKKEAEYNERQAQEYLTGDEAADVFNRESGQLGSIRSLRLRSIIQRKFNVDWKTTSLKKLSPVKQAQNPTATTLLGFTSMTNKMLHHHRRSLIFSGQG